jgi:hypothetical protein
MTECNTEALDFGRLGRRAVIADFEGGRLTCDAGAMLLQQVDEQLGLIDAINDCIPDPRDLRYVTHQQRGLLGQRIIAIAQGYEDVNDHQTLRQDPALKVAAQCSPEDDDPMASPSTLCRVENRINRQTIVELHRVMVDQFLDSYAAPPEEITLDFDATDDPTHGDQEGRFFHGYYRHYCFLPLYVFCGDQILCAYLRPSKIDGAKHSRAITKLLVDRIRQRWPDVRIVIRGDGGFCRWKLMRWCDNHNVKYIFGIARNKVLARRIKVLMDEAEVRFLWTGEKQRLFGETEYAARSWDRPRRIIMKAERMIEGVNPRFVVTNLEGRPASLYDNVYTQRGEMENRIKEQQLMLFADRTSCHGFLANQFRLLLSSFAYMLVEGLRRVGLAGTELAKAQVSTIRTKLLKVAARVQISVRRVVFHMASNFPHQDLFRVIHRALLRPG